MTNKRERDVIGIVIIFVIVFTTLNTFIHSRNEFITGYDFEISKIEMTPTKHLLFYDKKGKQAVFWNYDVMTWENVSKGDSVHKAPCSEFLYIYKRNGTGTYRELMRKAPSGVFPCRWFCK